ncbi:hypothetical protein P5705_22800 [Pseudomonas entomophila]|nr:hypothetical protein [Pseudomonas entomophila]MDF9620487.1 hypothetical protein [Pseudomonas entomophila]
MLANTGTAGAIHRVVWFASKAGSYRLLIAEAQKKPANGGFFF